MGETMGFAKGVKGSFSAAKGSFKGKGKGEYVMVPMWVPKGKGKGKGKGKKGLNGIKPESKVWIGNLDANVSWKDLKEHFDQAGKTKWVEPFKKGKGKGTGGVGYSSPQEAQSAIEMLNGSVLGGAMIEVDVWNKRTD